MFIGHYGVALALKRADPKLSLGTLFLATQFVDILWTVFIILGWERARVDPGHTAASPFQFLSYPLSHSLAAAFVWAVVAAAMYYSRPSTDSSHRRRGAVIVGIAVASHWFLDAIVHLPDLPLLGDQSRKVGFGLWDSVVGTWAVELSLLGLGLFLYLGAKSKRHPAQPVRLALAVGIIVALAATSLLGPPPASMNVVAVVGLLSILGIAWLGGWADRDPVPAGADQPGKGKKSRRR